MKEMLRSKLNEAMRNLARRQAEGGEEAALSLDFVVEEPRDPNHGHLATNAAMLLARVLKKKPSDMADMIIGAVDNDDGYIEKMEKAGPGFVNFTLSMKWWAESLKRLRAAGNEYGRGGKKGRRVMVEYVSANPTGPLHVGHGRGAAIGDALARVLEYAGYEVSCEYYINDAGRQMRILGESVYARLLELSGSDEPFPDDHYRGDYIAELAREVWDREGPDVLLRPCEETTAELTVFAKDRILDGIKDDLSFFRARHDVWFSETSLYENGLTRKALEFLKSRGHLYEQDGALWFKSEILGDDKDRVLVKSNGDQTYFAADVAYHWDKFERGFDHLVNVLGADHHGYVARMKAAVKALGREADDLDVVLVQLVSLARDGKPVAMSTRAGTFVTLREVVEEVGPDAARFIFLTRSSDSALEFDLNLAKSQTKDNPVYYVQYVGARISSILKAAAPGEVEPDYLILKEPEEVALIKHLTAFPELIQMAARRLEPHHLTVYLGQLAKLFHHYYGRCRIAADDASLAAARLALAEAVAAVTRIGLNLLGVEFRESMCLLADDKPRKRRRSRPSYEEANVSPRDRMLARVDEVLSDDFLLFDRLKQPKEEAREVEEEAAQVNPAEAVEEAAEAAVIFDDAPVAGAEKRAAGNGAAAAASVQMKKGAENLKKTGFYALHGLAQALIVAFVLGWAFLLGIVVGRGHLWETSFGTDMIVWLEKKAGWASPARVPEIIWPDEEADRGALPPPSSSDSGAAGETEPEAGAAVEGAARNAAGEAAAFISEFSNHAAPADTAYLISEDNLPIAYQSQAALADDRPAAGGGAAVLDDGEGPAPADPAASAPAANIGAYAVQTAFAMTEAEARAKAAKLESQGFRAYYYPTAAGRYPVRAGRFATRAEAEKTLVRLKGLGYRDSYVSKIIQ
ncbi:MAG: arginine--tRNA ligase [Candidatus Adiutrix sp.]|jgi:arginyl-tRNA synthetase|nr:arginine--tRNA ligase [Candidatus Adiutrix sp.]